MSAPFQAIVPSAGAISEASTRNRLDLPEPLAPFSSNTWPALRANDTPANTQRPPRRQARSCTVRSALLRAPTAWLIARPGAGGARRQAAVGLREDGPEKEMAAISGGAEMAAKLPLLSRLEHSLGGLCSGGDAQKVKTKYVRRPSQIRRVCD